MLLAHSENAAGRPQSLSEHLTNVAGLAGDFGAAFGAQELCRLAGLWHDVGKADPEWQRYLRESAAGQQRRGSGPDHKAAGASLALDAHQELVALLIQAHHGGLQSPSGGFKPWFHAAGRRPGVDAALQAIEREVPGLREVQLPPRPEYASDPLATEVLLRLAYSALVDADTLDTVAHHSGGLAARGPGSPTLDELWRRFEEFERRTGFGPDTPVNRVRREVRQACIDAAEAEPGIFRLTVPTGGGKTRSGMAFALRHAIKHDLRRVIVAVPFTTITQQTAGQYRAIFERLAQDPRPVVVEHHSAVAEQGGVDEDFSPGAVWQRLAAENWDAPVIVTTTVQLFESLFSNMRSRARKLHRLAGSVIILDEAQALPVGLLSPILDGLKQLVAHFSVTVVLSTATQPAFDSLEAFRGLALREIVPGHQAHFEQLRRVRYSWRVDRRFEWNEVAGWMKERPACLAVVNTRRHANELLDALDDPAALHLSTNLCGAHRSDVLDVIRARLRAGQPCRVVATQVVEAGVDLDFPAVFRAIGPLDSIIQAAGRCNREGTLAQPGEVVVFQPPDDRMPPGPYRTGAGLAQVVSARPGFDPGMPGSAAEYSQLLFQTAETDSHNIQALRRKLDFPAVAREFRMIAEETDHVLVVYGSASERRLVERVIEAINHRVGDPRLLYRQLQPYLVAARRAEAARLTERGFIESEECVPGVKRWLGLYDEIRGLVADDVPYVA